MSDTRAAIEASNLSFTTNIGRQDAAALAGLYTSNGCVMPTNSDIISGAANIQGFWQSVFDMGIRAAAVETIDLEEHGDTAIEVGRYTLKGDAGAVADYGKYIVIWKHEDGAWKLHRDIFNTSKPPA